MPEQKGKRKAKKRTRFNFIHDTEWVYNNIDVTRPTKAPSFGAGGFLLWAREHKNEFYRSYLRPLMPAGKALEEELERADDVTVQDMVTGQIAEIRAKIGRVRHHY